MKIQRRPITAKNTETQPSSFFVLTETKLNSETVQTVNARQLHKWLDVKTDYNDWIKRRIEDGRFIENKDFLKIPQKKVCDKINNLTSKILDHHISLDMAKHLAMMERNEKGFEARQYFIDCEKELLKQQQRQNHMPRGYPQMLQMAREDWKATRNELIQVIGTHLSVYDRKRKSQFTDQMYLQLIETRAQQLRAHFELHRPQELTRDYLHQLIQEAVCEVEIRMSDAIISGTVTDWYSFNEVLNVLLSHTRVMKEIQNGRTPLPSFAFPQVNAVTPSAPPS